MKKLIPQVVLQSVMNALNMLNVQTKLLNVKQDSTILVAHMHHSNVFVIMELHGTKRKINVSHVNHYIGKMEQTGSVEFV